MKEKLLKFVTGLERQPLLGFKYLNPPFIVNKIPVQDGQIKLPASHTCANVLDLPYYGNTQKGIQLMMETTLKALNEGQGFYMV